VPVTEQNFRAIFDRLRAIDLFGQGPPDPPFGTTLTVEAVKPSIESASTRLPLVYRRVYVDPLVSQLQAVLQALEPLKPEDRQMAIEALAGAVYDHSVHEVAAPLHRFLAVISNLYRSFLDAQRRMRAHLPLRGFTPPLALFQHSGRKGPYTYGVDAIESLCGGLAGVVSLPSTYRDHPLLWASLAHETGGHDVLHADPGLLEELGDGVAAFFGGAGGFDPLHLTGAQVLAILWSWWIDEAASDVYGLLNIGPAFGLNLIAFFAALNARAHHTDQPVLRIRSGQSVEERLDRHPIDVLRPHIAIGVIQSLRGLNPSVRDGYVRDLNMLTDLCSGGAQNVEVVGFLPLQGGGTLPLNAALPLKDMQDAARRVGAFIASTPLHALGNHSIQDIETWDDADEAVAVRIAEILKSNHSAVGGGDDAQLLAGATLALLDQPAAYDTVTSRLDEALDFSFATDPIWGLPIPDQLYVPDAEVEAGSRLDRYAFEVQLVGRTAASATVVS
jgi:hypothetical protein